MCDEFTAIAEDRALAARGLTRRQFAITGSAIALVCCTGAKQPDDPALVENTVRIPTADGTADAFFVHPAKGAHPGIVLWPDIAGLRDANKIMARRLAADGYAVLVVNQYYRGATAPLFGSFAEWRTPEGQQRVAKLREALTPDAIVRDARAYVAFLDGQAAVDTKRGIGTSGYCMGGPFAVRTAAAGPGRVGAVASFHGAGLVTPDADSPHRLIKATKAAFLFAIGRNDDARAPGDKDALREAAKAADRPAEIEVYPADHGWCVADVPPYDAEQAERAWQRMKVLFAQL